jgi:hypothetical protein
VPAAGVFFVAKIPAARFIDGVPTFPKIII